MSEITLTSDITVRLIDRMGGDHSVVAAARVSTCGADAIRYADPSEAEGNAGLISYLIRHRHGSPFEHSALAFFVHAPIFVWREWHRHRIGFAYTDYGSPDGDPGMGQSFNEESGRYKPLDPVFWVPRRDRSMVPVPGWKPGRPKFWTLEQHAEYALPPDASELDIRRHANEAHFREVDRKRRAYQAAYDAYRESIADGVALEVARSVLPVGIYSSCWVTTNPRSLMAFLSLRTHEPDAAFVSYPQAEIEECARACEAVLAEGWPLTHAAFLANGRVGP